MCEYCDDRNNGIKVIAETIETDIGKFEMFVEDGEVVFNSYDNDITIIGGAKINFCPMCGRKL